MNEKAHESIEPDGDLTAGTPDHNRRAADLTITRDGELMVAHIEAETDEATEFVDSYQAVAMIVVDSGRIVVPDEELPRLAGAAREFGLTLGTATT